MKRICCWLLAALLVSLVQVSPVSGKGDEILVNHVNLEAGLSAEEPVIKTVSYVDNGRALSNPDMGFMIYYYDNSTRYYDCMADDSDLFTDIPGGNVIYLRLPWCHVEPEEGRFNWSFIDTQIQKFSQAGKSVMLAITCAETGVRYATPRWVRDAGAKGNFWKYGSGLVGEDQGLWMPDNTDPVFMAKLENLLKEAARKYDGNPNVSCMEVRSLGIWGEGHAAESGIPITAQATKDHAALHMKYFKKTPVLIQEELVRDSKTSKYVLNLGLGFREDSVVGDYVNNRWWDPGYAQNAKDYWPKQPVALETLHIKESGQEWVNGTTLLQSIEDYHASYVSIHHYARPFVKGNPDFMAAANSRIGYRLMPVQASWKRSVQAGEAFPVSLTWQNRGVAPFYRDGWPRLTVTNQAGETVAQWEDPSFRLKQLEPGAKGSAPTRSETIENSLPGGLPDGRYSIYLSAVRSDGSGTVDMPLDTEKGEDGYLLGTFLLSGQTDPNENPEIGGKGRHERFAADDFEGLTGSYPPSGRDFVPILAGSGEHSVSGFELSASEYGQALALINQNNATDSAGHPELVSQSGFSGEYSARFDFQFRDETRTLQHVYLSPIYTKNDAVIRLEQNQIALQNGQTVRQQASLDLRAGQWYTLRMALTDNTICAKVWPRGEAEPAGWAVQYRNYSGLAGRDPAQFRLGYLSRTPDTAEQAFLIDNLELYRSYYMRISPAQLCAADNAAPVQLTPVLQPPAANSESIRTDGLRIQINDIYNRAENSYRLAEIEIYDTDGKNLAAASGTRMSTNIGPDEIEPTAPDRDYGTQHLIDGSIKDSKSWWIMVTKASQDERWKEHYIQFDFEREADLSRVALYCDENFGLTRSVKNIDIQVRKDGVWTDQRQNHTVTWPEMDTEQARVNKETIPLVQQERTDFATRGVRLKVNDIYQYYEAVYRIAEVELFGTRSSAPGERINLAPLAALSSNVQPAKADPDRDYLLSNLTDGSKDWLVYLTENLKNGAYRDSYIQFDFDEEVHLEEVAVTIDGGLGQIQGVKNLDVQILKENGSWVTVKPDCGLDWKLTLEEAEAYRLEHGRAAVETISIPVTGQDVQVNWRSDDPAIADVSPNGIVTFYRAGNTSIRASYGGYNEVEIPVEVYSLKATPVSAKIDRDPEVSTYLSGRGSGAVSVEVQRYEEQADAGLVDLYLAVYRQDGSLSGCHVREGIDPPASGTMTVTFDHLEADAPGGLVKAIVWRSDRELVPAGLCDAAAIPAAAAEEEDIMRVWEADAVPQAVQAAEASSPIKLASCTFPNQASVRGAVSMRLSWENPGAAPAGDLYPAVTLRDRDGAVAGVFVNGAASLKSLGAEAETQEYTFQLPDVLGGGRYEVYLSAGTLDGTPTVPLEYEGKQAGDLRCHVGTLSIQGDYDVRVSSITAEGGTVTAVLRFIGHTQIPSTNSPVLEGYRTDVPWLGDVPDWRTSVYDLAAVSSTWSSAVRNQLNASGEATVTAWIGISPSQYGKSYDLKINMHGTDSDIIQSDGGRMLKLGVMEVSQSGEVTFRELRQ